MTTWHDPNFGNNDHTATGAIAVMSYCNMHSALTGTLGAGPGRHGVNGNPQWVCRRCPAEQLGGGRHTLCEECHERECMSADKTDFQGSAVDVPAGKWPSVHCNSAS